MCNRIEASLSEIVLAVRAKKSKDSRLLRRMHTALKLDVRDRVSQGQRPVAIDGRCLG